jgi:hypothetical protein
LIGGVKMMLILMMGVLRIDLSKFRFHNIKLTKMILLLILPHLFILILLFLIKLLFSKPGNGLHFLLVIFAFSVSHFILHSFMLFGLLR